MRYIPLFVLALCPFALIGQDLNKILNEELQRNFTILKQKADPAPYFIAYEVNEIQGETFSASLGHLEATNKGHTRHVDVMVRVGSAKLDNYHVVDGQRPRYSAGGLITIDNVSGSIRRELWRETDRAYRIGAQRLIQIKSNEQLKITDKDAAEDFSSEPPQVHQQTPAPLQYSADEWSARVKKWSALLAKYPAALNSNVGLSVNRQTTYLVNTEGTRLEFGRTFASLVVTAEGRAPDGMDLTTVETFQATEPDRLPKPEVIEAAINRVGADLTNLVNAPVIEPFLGPAILSGRAAGVFFHEIFGHRIEGQRQADESEGQTFAKSVGTGILPSFLSVTFDATRHNFGSVDLNGWYDYDDEGVKARPVRLVKDGVLDTFLLSREPIPHFDRSNGHGRRQAGFEPVSRQSNLIVESSKQVSDKQLRDMLIAEIKRQNKPYGLFFEQVTGGYTLTQRRGLQAYTVIPLVLYRVYPDGRPDELVRGADIVGTPLASFAKILATSDKADVFNGYCGAESGSVPVSAISPALLISEIEVQKKEKSQERPPFLPPPTATSDGGGR